MGEGQGKMNYPLLISEIRKLNYPMSFIATIGCSHCRLKPPAG